MAKKTKSSELPKKSPHYTWEIRNADNGFIARIYSDDNMIGSYEPGTTLVFGDPVSLMLWFAKSIGVPLEYSPAPSTVVEEEKA